MLLSQQPKPKLFFGKYRAFARDIHDPERLGRIRLEVPTVLGIGKDHWSNWAWPCFPYGGSPDTGMFLVPNEGSCVWAEFEGGKVQYPIWSGVWFGGSNPGEIPAEAAYMCDSVVCKDCGEDLEHKPDTTDNREHEKYHGHPPFYCPRVKVLFKSETGHTIVADDRHEKESLKIIDRAGQTFSMSAPIKADLQEEPLLRGEKTSENNDQFDINEEIVDQKASIKITDLSGQSLCLDATKDNENITLISQNKDGSRKQTIQLDTKISNEKILLSSINDSQSLIIDSTSGAENITIKDKEEQIIKLDASSTSITLKDKDGDQTELSNGSITLKNKLGSKLELSDGNIDLKDVVGDSINLNSGSITLKDLSGNTIKTSPGMVTISDALGSSVKMMPGMLSIKPAGILMLG